VADCGEQLAWLAAALRCSSDNRRTVYSKAFVSREANDYPNLATLKHLDCTEALEEESGFVSGFTIDVEEVPDHYTLNENGLLLSILSKSIVLPVIALNFPTARRPQFSSGYEFSFELLLKLIDGHVSHENKSIRLIGSFATLELAYWREPICYWHSLDLPWQIVCDNRHTPQRRLPRGDHLVHSVSDLELARHIICSCKREAILAQNDGKVPQIHSPRLYTYINMYIEATHKSVDVNGNLFELSSSISLDTAIFSISRNSEPISSPDNQTPGFHFFLRVLRRIIYKFQTQCNNGIEIGQVDNSDIHDNDVAKDKASDTSNGNQTNNTPAHGTGKDSSQRRKQTAEGQNSPEEGDDEDEEEKSRRPRKRRKIGDANGTGCLRYLACPFWKLDPKKHWECFSKKTTKISYVKQHLHRRHTPSFYCQRCYAIFPNEKTCDEHTLVVSCTRLSEQLDGVSQYQSKRLARKVTGTVEEQWYAMWHILFPKRPRPITIYIDFEQSEDFSRISEFSQQHGPGILRQELLRSGLVLKSGMDDETMNQIISKALHSMFRHLRQIQYQGESTNRNFQLTKSNISSESAHRFRPSDSTTVNLDSGIRAGFSILPEQLGSTGQPLYSRSGDPEFLRAENITFAPPLPSDLGEIGIGSNDLHMIYPESADIISLGPTNVFTAGEDPTYELGLKGSFGDFITNSSWNDISMTGVMPDCDEWLETIAISGSTDINSFLQKPL
jgi:hypothetical protein